MMGKMGNLRNGKWKMHKEINWQLEIQVSSGNSIVNDFMNEERNNLRRRDRRDSTLVLTFV